MLVLTERTEHLDAIKTALTAMDPAALHLHGRMSRKQRAALIAELDALPPEAPRILLATGKLVGEGFDHPPLDTLVLAMPVSWKGTLQQYAGRLHREHASKTDVRIIDFVDTGHPALLRMWESASAAIGRWGIGWPTAKLTTTTHRFRASSPPRVVPVPKSAALFPPESAVDSPGIGDPLPRFSDLPPSFD